MYDIQLMESDSQSFIPKVHCSVTVRQLTVHGTKRAILEATYLWDGKYTYPHGRRPPVM